MSFAIINRNSVRILIVAVGLLILATGALAEDSVRKVRTRVTPNYPELARKVNVRGTVKIEVFVAPSGTVKKMRVIGGHPLLVGAAEDALKQWKYEPAAEETITVVEFNFVPGM